jgi:MerR family transcriptional regulator, thiopeptide resistance regulator
MSGIEVEELSIGELAHRAGLTVRTLQYYDREDVLKARIDDAGRRRYRTDDVLKLQQVLFLKSLGFSLDDIRGRIPDEPSPTALEELFTHQRELLLHEIDRLRESVELLDRVIPEVHSDGTVSLNRLVMMIELTAQDFPYTSGLRFLSESQLQALSSHDALHGRAASRIKELTTRLIDLYRSGSAPGGRSGQDFAAEWWAIVTEATQGDQDLLDALLRAGSAVGEWPVESRELISAIQHFLTAALETYFTNNNIHFTQEDATSTRS